ncbi:MAG TPA: bifunctional nuclease family protein [Anaerolineales bacterium]|nr:bifunctional nuclease family protein [Anaerolineales bacterium]
MPDPSTMVEVVVDSIRVSLMSQHRIVILKDVASDRFLTIWIGQNEAEAITVALQEIEVVRPLTHDLLRNVLVALGAEVLSVNIVELKNDIFFARIALKVNDREVEIDSRPSDALALAVRVHVPIYVAETVMREAASLPESEVEREEVPAEGDERLEVFKDFVDSLDLDDLDPSEGDSEE